MGGVDFAGIYMLCSFNVSCIYVICYFFFCSDSAYTLYFVNQKFCYALSSCSYDTIFV